MTETPHGIVSYFWDAPITIVEKLVLRQREKNVMVEAISPSGEWWIRFTSMIPIERIFDDIKQIMPHGSYSVPKDALQRTVLIKFNATWGKWPEGYAVRDFIDRLRMRGFHVLATERAEKDLKKALSLHPNPTPIPRMRTKEPPPVPEFKTFDEAFKLLGLPITMPKETLRRVSKHILAAVHPDQYPEKLKEYFTSVFQTRQKAIQFLLENLPDDGNVEGFGFMRLFGRK